MTPAVIAAMVASTRQVTCHSTANRSGDVLIGPSNVGRSCDAAWFRIRREFPCSRQQLRDASSKTKHYERRCAMCSTLLATAKHVIQDGKVSYGRRHVGAPPQWLTVTPRP